MIEASGVTVARHTGDEVSLGERRRAAVATRLMTTIRLAIDARAILRLYRSAGTSAIKHEGLGTSPPPMIAKGMVCPLGRAASFC